MNSFTAPGRVNTSGPLCWRPIQQTFLSTASTDPQVVLVGWGRRGLHPGEADDLIDELSAIAPNAQITRSWSA